MKNDKHKNLALNLGLKEHEYNEIVKRLGREVNELEVYLFSAMWSEHCGYKHSKLLISQFPKNNAILADENAGGVQIGNHVVFFKVESHNHPSAVEPYQGASTGIGGIIRDILALNARPIALLNSLKFGCLDNERNRHLHDGVVSGISDYGNCIGVPTVAGEVTFDECYNNSPLVNVMAVGIAPVDKVKLSAAKPNYKVILLGAHTGRDGTHGASFASKDLRDNVIEEIQSVQVGDPFMKKCLIESTLEILSLDGVIACQDCGAAGLLSSTSEMAYKGGCGITLELDKVHLREESMLPWEIMLSESQERMIILSEADTIPKIQSIADKYDVPMSVIGYTHKNEAYNLHWNGECLASLSPKVLNEAVLYDLESVKPNYISNIENRIIPCVNNNNLIEDIKKVISDVNFASKKWIYSQYDSMVGNRNVIKAGMSDVSALEIYEEDYIIGLTMDSNPRAVYVEPFEGVRQTVLESYRNLVSNGFKPLGLTNCLNYGNPERSDVAYQLVETVKGIKNVCESLCIPVVSGNVSLYNESSECRVYPTPVIGMIGGMHKTEGIINSHFSEGETVLLLGNSINDNSNVAGSLYQKVLYDFIGGKIESSCIEDEMKIAEFILNNKKLISACVDVSEGGVFGALFEALHRGKIGFIGDIISSENTDALKILFGEIPSRYLVSTVLTDEVTAMLAEYGINYSILGICRGSNIKFNGYSLPLNELGQLYDNKLSSIMSN